jgi:hypothetical protein
MMPGDGHARYLGLSHLRQFGVFIVVCLSATF